LCQADDCLVQTDFTVVIGRMCRHEAGKLSDLSQKSPEQKPNFVKRTN
jgi:hypothetical protein